MRGTRPASRSSTTTWPPPRSHWRSTESTSSAPSQTTRPAAAVRGKRQWLDLDLTYWGDATNTQGADAPTDLPGLLLATFSDVAVGAADAFAFNASGPFAGGGLSASASARLAPWQHGADYRVPSRRLLGAARRCWQTTGQRCPNRVRSCCSARPCCACARQFAAAFDRTLVIHPRQNRQSLPVLFWLTRSCQSGPNTQQGCVVNYRLGVLLTILFSELPRTGHVVRCA